MLTVPEAAARVRKNPETVRRWIREGKLRARKVGTQHVIDEPDLAAFAPASSRALPVPESWKRTHSGALMPDVLADLRRDRASH